MAVTNKGSGTVSEGPGGTGTRILSKRYPVEEGLTAGDSLHSDTPYLEEEC